MCFNANWEAGSRNMCFLCSTMSCIRIACFPIGIPDRVSSLDEDTKSCDLSVLNVGIRCDMSPLVEVCLIY